MTTLPDPPRSALVDPSSGQLTREWVRFFDDLRRAIVSGLDDSVGGRLDALEADSVFAGGDGAGGSSGSYNDAAVRARIEALELEVLFPAARGGSADAEVAARLALLEESAADQAIEAAVVPDPTADLRRMMRRLADLETENLF